MTITKEGALASFYTVNKAPIKHLKVYFSPKQAGEGDPSPSNVREISGWSGLTIKHTGLNIAEFEAASNYFVYYIPQELVNKEMIYSNFIDNTNGSSTAKIRISCRDENNNSISNLSRKTSITARNSGRDIFTFGGNISIPANTHHIYFGTSGNDAVLKEPMIEFNVKQSIWDYSKYEPYRGQTYRIKFPGIGKNLLDSSNYIYSFPGLVFGGSVSSAYADGTIKLAAGTYTFSVNVECYIISITNIAGKILDGVKYNVNTYTFTLPTEDAVRIMVVKLNATESELLTYEYQLEVGSTATAYEPFNNTIYGGYVDLVTGELVKNWKYEDIKANVDLYSWGYTNVENHYFATRITNIADSSFYNAKQLFTHGIVDNPYEYSRHQNESCSWLFNQSLRVGSFGYTSLDDWKNYINSQQSIGLYYELATPITHTLTPAQLSTLIGRNNIWSNADRVEVEYDLAESNDELYRRRNILLRSAPHIETASGNPVTFTTDMRKPLKGLTIPFTPIQAGTGNPSPTNVRPISGISGLTAYRTGKNIIDKQDSNRFYSTFIPNGTTVTVSCKNDGGTTNVIRYYNKYKSEIDWWNINRTEGSRKYRSFTTLQNTYFIKFDKDCGDDQLEFGDTPSTYKPYSGTTIPVTFPVLGKNLYDYISNPIVVGGIIGSTGTENNSTQRLRCGFIEVTENTSYTISFSGSVSQCFGYFYNGSKSFLSNSGAWKNSSQYLTTPANAKYMRLVFATSSNRDLVAEDISNLMVNIGTTAETYEPFTNTCYGGELDLVKGRLFVEWKYVSGANLTWIKNDAGYTFSNVKSSQLSNVERTGTDINVISSNYIGVSHQTRTRSGANTNNEVCIHSSASNISIRNSSFENMTIEDISTALADVQFAYKLATPIEYILTPTQLKTLKGINNIWTNSNGPVEIKYWTH